MAVDFDRLVLAPCMRHLGRVDVQYTAPQGQAVGRRGIFSREHQIALDGDNAAHSADVPMLGIRLSEWDPAPVQGGTIVVPGQGQFQVFDVQPDGEGGAELILRATT